MKGMVIKMENILDLTPADTNVENTLQNETNEKGFFDNILGKAINTAADVAIKAALPDFLEDQVIKIKDNLVENGLIDGIKKTIGDVVDFGKDILGLGKEETPTTERLQTIVKDGGILESASELWDYAVDKAKDSGLIKSKDAKTLSKGKKEFVEEFEKVLKNTIEEQTELQATEKRTAEIDSQLELAAEI